MAQADFNSLNLSDIKIYKTSKGETIVGKTSDGYTVTVRPSNDGGRGRYTIEIRSSNNRKVKEIRYSDQ